LKEKNVINVRIKLLTDVCIHSRKERIAMSVKITASDQTERTELR